MRFIQIEHSELGRRVGVVEEPDILLLTEVKDSLFGFLKDLIDEGDSLSVGISASQTDKRLNYEDVYSGNSPWRILPSIDIPDDPMKCVLSGTGLTHKTSAENRQKMHQFEAQENLSDSMKMYLMGEKEGKPGPGEIGVQPEWFFKGNGTNLIAHGGNLEIPAYAEDGGEEPEIAGIYIISAKGIPHRVGFVQANEFSDHIMEKKNYLYLAPSKLRNCAIGPELVTDLNFGHLEGEVKILRKKEVLWSQAIHTGENNMAHSLANLEYHHFKYDQHRLPGQLHIHFFGADAFSFGQNITLQHGDEMQVHFEGMGRPLVNYLSIAKESETSIEIRGLE